MKKATEARRPGPWLAAMAGLLLAGAAAAQPMIRMNPGQGATLLNIGNVARREVLLTQDVPPGSGLVREGNPPSLCCIASTPGTRCESDRGLPLGAPASTVRERHGTPVSTIATEMRYKGIAFELSGSPPRVQRICVFKG